MRITVFRESPDRLSGEEWEFVLTEDMGALKLFLAQYCPMARATPRHKWKPKGAGYNVYKGGIFDGFPRVTTGLTPEQVPMPEDVMAQARRDVQAGIVVLPAGKTR